MRQLIARRLGQSPLLISFARLAASREFTLLKPLLWYEGGLEIDCFAVPCRFGPWLCQLEIAPAPVAAQLFFMYFNAFYAGHGVYNGRESTKTAEFLTEYEKAVGSDTFPFTSTGSPTQSVFRQPR